MSSPLQNSLFHFLLQKKDEKDLAPVAIMGGVSGSHFDGRARLADLPIVFFDFETTGLDTRTARIIEIGAIKYRNREEVERFSQLVFPNETLSPEITQITGITNDMLADKPPVHDVLPHFHNFLRGCVGVAHNAEFDVGMLFYESQRMGIACDYTILCTLKMARQLVKIERRSLDALARHYGLSFESRHRSIGDILVTAQVFWRIVDENPHLSALAGFDPYREPVPDSRARVIW